MAAATTQEQRQDEYRRMDDYDNSQAANSMNEWSSQLAECQRKWLDFIEVWTRTALYPMRAFQQVTQQHRN